MGVRLDFKTILIRLGINQAREKRALVTEIRLASAQFRKLREGLNKWIKKEDVLLSESSDSSSYTYGGPSYNGSFLKGRQYITTELFSTFKLVTTTDDGYIDSMTFHQLSNYDVENCKEYKNYDPTKTPSMLQIFYGLRKKYNDTFMFVSGDFDLPEEEKIKLNDLEPTFEEIQEQEARKKKIIDKAAEKKRKRQEYISSIGKPDDTIFPF